MFRVPQGIRAFPKTTLRPLVFPMMKAVWLLGVGDLDGPQVACLGVEEAEAVVENLDGRGGRWVSSGLARQGGMLG